MKKQNEEFVNEQSASSQKAKILEHLKKGLTITPLEALKLCGCFRLSARIYDLKDDGWDIVTNIATVNGKRVAQYRLEIYGGSANNPYDMPFEEAQEYAFHRGFDIPMSDGDVLSFYK